MAPRFHDWRSGDLCGGHWRLCLLLIVRLSSGAIVWENLPLILRLLPALAIVFGIGLIDDIVSVRPWIRLAVEAVAATFAWIGGFT